MMRTSRRGSNVRMAMMVMTSSIRMRRRLLIVIAARFCLRNGELG
jgi:hypothetical protein